jgi:hypothetical protein
MRSSPTPSALRVTVMAVTVAAAAATTAGRASAATATAPASGTAKPAPATAAPAAPAPATSLAPTAAAATAPLAPARGLIADPAPRPVTAVRVQSRYAVKAKQAQMNAGFEYLSRGDFYISPGARIGVGYYPLEQLGIELQVSHFWSSLNAEAERIRRTLGAIPDSHAPGWLMLAGARYSFGYGKLMVGGLGGVLHFEPQVFLRGGLHAHDGDTGPSADAGLGLLVFVTPKFFARIDTSLVFEREQRSGNPVSVWGILPAIGVGGTL